MFSAELPVAAAVNSVLNAIPAPSYDLQCYVIYAEY